MKILAIGDPHGYYNYKKSILKKADLILITGDIGKADLARKRAFERYEREKKGLPERDYGAKQERQSHMEIYNSTMKIIKPLSKFAPVYSILGNVWPSDKTVKKDEKKLGVKIPHLVFDMKKVKDFNIVKNSTRKIENLKVGFLEYFIDTNWVKDFKPGNYIKKMRDAKKESDKAKRIVRGFGKVDILVCHQPPYGILDKVTWKKAPKHWLGKHAGSKIILDYIKKYQPKIVLCGHIHEGKGKKKIGKTLVYNAGCCGDYFLLNIK